MPRTLALAILFLTALLTPGCGAAQDARVVLRNVSPAMEPTLKTGELVTVVAFPDSLTAVRTVVRGDLVLYAHPQEDTARYIKRLVGLPGDTLAMQRGLLFRNGERVHEPYAWFADSTAGERRNNWGPLVVPANAYFVLGDNRDNSADGRYWGFVPSRLLFGRAIDPESGQPRR